MDIADGIKKWRGEYILAATARDKRGVSRQGSSSRHFDILGRMGLFQTKAILSGTYYWPSIQICIQRHGCQGRHKIALLRQSISNLERRSCCLNRREDQTLGVKDPFVLIGRQGMIAAASDLLLTSRRQDCLGGSGSNDVPVTSMPALTGRITEASVMGLSLSRTGLRSLLVLGITAGVNTALDDCVKVYGEKAFMRQRS